MRRLLLVAASAALGAAAPAQSPPSTPAAPPPSTVSEVVVNATRSDAVTQFVQSATARNTSGRVARWDRSICVGSVGVTRQAGEYLNDRVAMSAVAVGLEPGKPGCRPNVLVVVAKDPHTIAADLVRTHYRLFQGGARNPAQTRGNDRTLQAFVDSPDPVRWWHVSEQVTQDGIAPDGNLTGKVDGNPTVAVHDASRVKDNMRDDFRQVIIIVDPARMNGISFQAFGDYLAMVVLAQISPQANFGSFPSVLNIFRDRDAGRTPVAGMTEWDLAYLKGLYGARRDRDPRREISDTMKKQAKVGAKTGP